MSMAIQRSKYTGDPGIFGDIWGGIKGAARIGLGVAGTLPVVGGAARIASQYLFRPAPGTTTYSQAPIGSRMPSAPQLGPGGVPPEGYAEPFHSQGSCPPGKLQGPRGVCRWPRPSKELFGVDTRGIFLGSQRGPDPNGGQNGMAFQATTAMMAGKATGFPGYHWNKSGYFLMSGEYVPPGTRAVKNRRMNPCNPRAVSSSIRRVKGAKRFAKSLSSITIRKHHHHSRH